MRSETMDLLIRLILMIFIGGFIGYSTNKVAIKMLFRPYEEKRFLFFKIQGVLPKRKQEISESIGIKIEEAFLSKDDVFNALLSDDMKAKFKQSLKEELSTKIYDFIPAMFRSMLGGEVKNMINRFIDAEGDAIIENLVKKIETHGMEALDIQGIVKDKMDAMDLRSFEKLVYDVVRSELRHIELVGLILGMVIGLAQFGFTIFV